MAANRSTWAQKSQAIEDAFRKLPAWQPSNDFNGIPPSFFIPGIGRELLLMSPIKIAPKEAPAKSLTALRHSTDKVLAVLASMAPEAEEALNFRPGRLRELTAHLRILNAAAQNPAPYRKRGAPTKVQPRKIVETIGLRYFMVTGRKPTVPKRREGMGEGRPYGLFLELVGTIFEILEVQAKPVSQAEHVARNWDSILKAATGKN